MRTLFRRARRQCARRWHSLVPLACLSRRTTRRRSDGVNDGGDRDAVCSSTLDDGTSGGTLTTFGICLLSALLAFALFVLALFISGLSDHFFETPFDQFRWSNVDVREQVVRDLLGRHALRSAAAAADHQQPLSPAVPINPWPTLFPHPLIEPSCRHTILSRHNSVLIIVKSAPDRLKHRDAVRATFGALKRYPPPPTLPQQSVLPAAATSGDARAEDNGAGGGTFFRLRTIFVMGRPSSSTVDTATPQMDALEREAATHGDLLVGDFADAYFNNTLKFVHSVRYARHHCALANLVPYVLMLDDDFLLFPWNLVAELQRHVPNERLYMGWRFDTSPFRARMFKWRVSLDEFPFAAFPPYIAAGAVLLTGQTIAEFYAAIPHTPLFRLDDVYAGILAYLLAIQPQHNANFVFYRQSGASAEQILATSPAMVALHDFLPEEMREAYTKVAQQRQQQTKKKP